MKSFTISFNTDNEGFFSRECNNENCKKKFKVFHDQIKDEMYCPYCGDKFPNDELWTTEQAGYIRKIAEQKAFQYAKDKLSEMLSGVARQSKYMTFKAGPKKVFREPIKPVEREIETQILCPDCHTKFIVFGIFGYCPSCNIENMMIYDANTVIIKNEITNSKNKERALRHAYKDLVSTFEFYAKSFCKTYSLGITNFQELSGTRKLIRKSIIGIDIYENLNEEQKLFIRRLFQKRHTYEHNAGLINDKHVKQIPEDSKLLGQKAQLCLEEFDEGCKVLKLVLEPLVNYKSNKNGT